jgi:hypothetical protein
MHDVCAGQVDELRNIMTTMGEKLTPEEFNEMASVELDCCNI